MYAVLLTPIRFLQQKRMARYRDNCPLDCKVYVGELGNSGSRQELEDAFGYYGPLKNVWVARNPPGFAFVMFEDSRDARDACRALNGKMICGRRVRVELSSGKTRREMGDHHDGPPPPRSSGGYREDRYDRSPPPPPRNYGGGDRYRDRSPPPPPARRRTPPPRDHPRDGYGPSSGGSSSRGGYDDYYSRGRAGPPPPKRMRSRYDFDSCQLIQCKS